MCLSVCFHYFSDWLVDHGSGAAFEVGSKEDLAELLRRFYGDARKKDGSPYGKSALVNIRSGLNRHMTLPPWNRIINLMHDAEFKVANQVLIGQFRKIKMDGNDKTQHKPAISAADMKKMYNSDALDVNNPVGLQRKVFIDIMLHFSRRGREGLRELRKDSFVFRRDENDREFATIDYHELEKNHQGLHKHESEKDPRMYTQDDPKKCPVKSLKFYLDKLSKNSNAALFQKPNPRFKCNAGKPWYCNSPVGINLIGNMMNTISREAGLSKMYTNHCLGATAATVLSHNNFESRDICSVTGHKSTESIKNYVPDSSDDCRYRMSEVLHCYQTASDPSSKAKVPERVNPPPMPGTSADSESALIPYHQQNTQHTNVANSSTMLHRTLFSGAVFNEGCGAVINISGGIHFHNWCANSNPRGHMMQ